MKLTIVAGARPNFMKISPIINEINRVKKNNHNIEFRLVHTGQHYDENMSNSFFQQLNIPKPNINLNCGSGTHAEITSSIMKKFEKELEKNRPDLVFVVGDVTSTMACAIVAQKLKIKVAHIEAGIRSNDWSMPEEINRLVTDSITNFFFTTSAHANQNLLNEGVNKKNIFFVGNTMIDTLLANRKRFYHPAFWNKYALEAKNYFVLTLHRPSNVDNKKHLKDLIISIIDSTRDYKIIFPIHPRTKQIFDALEILESRLKIVPSLSYLEFNFLVENAFAVITDSGGITEETTVLGIPCITLRNSTERPETVELGTNELIGTNPKSIPKAMKKLFSNNWKKGSIPEKWDGKTSQRIINTLLKIEL
tara:strand:- start:4910 stop:6001 length:1092 start_codon:yes stop_codon:yes gene_type:complete